MHYNNVHNETGHRGQGMLKQPNNNRLFHATRSRKYRENLPPKLGSYLNAEFKIVTRNIEQKPCNINFEIETSRRSGLSKFDKCCEGFETTFFYLYIKARFLIDVLYNDKNKGETK